MTEQKDGGPAFPAVAEGGVDSGLHATFNPGMSLRDWFAGQALAGFLANPVHKLSFDTVDDGKYAYAIADAMLSARGSNE